MSHDKVRGLILGTAIGDALGMPVETFPYEKIKERHGRIEDYISASGHKWFDGQPLGSWTDDTQLSLAVAEAFIDSGGEFNMDAIAKWHVNAYNRHTSGWGPSTREAIKRLVDGVHWKDSGNTPRPEEKMEKKPSPRGLGNGIAMKIGPVGAYLATEIPHEEIIAKIIDFTAMTHRTSMAVSSGLAHAFAVRHCLINKPDAFSVPRFIDDVIYMCELGKNHFKDTLEDDITERMKLLYSVAEDPKSWPTERIVSDFGRGTCYVYNSLPFTYAFFVKYFNSIEGLYECVSAGGDTDSNASILAGLLGSLHGTSIFPKHLVDGLQEKNELIKIADKFYEKVFQKDKK